VLTDPLFPTAAFLPLALPEHVGPVAAMTTTERDDGYVAVDDYTRYHNECEAA
jgi:hypothetical protein